MSNDGILRVPECGRNYVLNVAFPCFGKLLWGLIEKDWDHGEQPKFLIEDRVLENARNSGRYTAPSWQQLLEVDALERASWGADPEKWSRQMMLTVGICPKHGCWWTLPADEQDERNYQHPELQQVLNVQKLAGYGQISSLMNSWMQYVMFSSFHRKVLDFRRIGKKSQFCGMLFSHWEHPVFDKELAGLVKEAYGGDIDGLVSSDAVLKMNDLKEAIDRDFFLYPMIYDFGLTHGYSMASTDEAPILKMSWQCTVCQKKNTTPFALSHGIDQALFYLFSYELGRAFLGVLNGPDEDSKEIHKVFCEKNS